MILIFKNTKNLPSVLSQQFPTSYLDVLLSAGGKVSDSCNGIPGTPGSPVWGGGGFMPASVLPENRKDFPCDK